jgi:glycosyltransferase involved in cell wall biosynthesis
MARRRLRVLLVSRELSPFHGGGIGTYVAEMARTLAAAGHEAHILTMPHDGLAGARGPIRPGDSCQTDSLPGIAVHTVALDGGQAALDAYPIYAMRHAMAVLEGLRRLWARHPFDLIEFPDYQAEGYFTLRARRTLGEFASGTLAVRLHSTTWLCRQADGDDRLDTELAHLEHMERSQAAEADLVIAPGRRVAERIIGADGPPCAVIPLPLDAAALRTQFGGPKEGHHPADPPTILFFGKLQHLKGPQDLLAAAHTLLDRGIQARFRFIGNDSPTGPFGGSMLEHLRRRIDPRHLGSFSFEPAIPRARLGPAIRQAALCCFPSRWEAFPMACLEAMALGAPVVVSDAGGLAEIVEDGRSGLISPAAAPDQLADCLARALADQALREALAAAAMQRVEALCNPAQVLAALEAAIPDRSSPRPGPPSRPPQRPSPSSPLVSIFIPHYNLGQYLPQAIHSVRSQTCSDYELIVIDDGSTDPASRAAVDALPGDVRIIRQANRGLGATRNIALSAARGRWVLPLDADDLLESTLLAKLLHAAAANPDAAYFSPLVAYFTDDGPARGGWVPLGIEPDMLLCLNVGGAASGSLIRREAALSVGGWDEAMPAYEDWEFWCRLAEAGARGVVIPEFLLRYRVRADSMFRTELQRHQHLHAHIIRRHPGLITDRAVRLLASRITPDPRAEADRLVRENIRYRLADRVNEALKKTGLQRAIKGVASRVAGES